MPTLQVTHKKSDLASFSNVATNIETKISHILSKFFTMKISTSTPQKVSSTATQAWWAKITPGLLTHIFLGKRQCAQNKP